MMEVDVRIRRSALARPGIDAECPQEFAHPSRGDFICIRINCFLLHPVRDPLLLINILFNLIKNN